MKVSLKCVLLSACFAGILSISTPHPAHASTASTEHPMESIFKTFGSILEWMGVSGHDWHRWGNDECWEENCNECNGSPSDPIEDDEDGEENGDTPVEGGDQ